MYLMQFISGIYDVTSFLNTKTTSCETQCKEKPHFLSFLHLHISVYLSALSRKNMHMHLGHILGSDMSCHMHKCDSMVKSMWSNTQMWSHSYKYIGPHIQMWDNIYKFRVTFINNVVLNIQMWDHTYKLMGWHKRQFVTFTNTATHWLLAQTVLHISITYGGQAPSVQVSTDLLVCWHEWHEHVQWRFERAG